MKTSADADATAARTAEPTASAPIGRAAADVAFVEALARILRENDLAELELKREYGDDDELTVRLSRVGPQVAYAAAPMALPAAPAKLAGPSPRLEGPDTAAAADPSAHPGCVTSPMVGTVYLSAEPSAAPFVAVGDRVEAGQTLLIIEAMKTMNQIPSPRSGTVRSILVANEQPVEYGAPLLIVD